MSRFHLVLVFLTYSILSTAQPKRIWIDTDIMVGKPGKDVDDGLALILALKSDTVEIQGISLEQKVDHGYKVAQKLIKWYSEEDIPVYKGAESFKDFGEENAAVAALAAALTKETLTIVAVGPVTNIASVLKRYPHLESQIREIVFCGGRRPGMHFNPGNRKRNLTDYNFDLDPAAFEFLLNSDVKLTLSGYEAAVPVLLNKQDIKSFKQTGRKGDRWVYRQLKGWLRFWKITTKSKDGFIPWDAITIGYVLTPEYLECERGIPVEINILENDARRINKNPEKPYLQVSYNFHSKRKVNYCYKTKMRYKQYLLKTLPGEK